MGVSLNGGFVVPPNHQWKNRVFHDFHHPFWGHYFRKLPIWRTGFHWNLSFHSFLLGDVVFFWIVVPMLLKKCLWILIPRGKFPCWQLLSCPGFLRNSWLPQVVNGGNSWTLEIAPIFAVEKIDVPNMCDSRPVKILLIDDADIEIGLKLQGPLEKFKKTTDRIIYFLAGKAHIVFPLDSLQIHPFPRLLLGLQMDYPSPLKKHQNPPKLPNKNKTHESSKGTIFQ